MFDMSQKNNQQIEESNQANQIESYLLNQLNSIEYIDEMKIEQKRAKMKEYKDKIIEHQNKQPNYCEIKKDQKLTSLRNNQSINECHYKLYQDQLNNIRIIQEIMFVCKTMNDHLKLHQNDQNDLVKKIEGLIDDYKQRQLEEGLSCKRKREKTELKEEFNYNLFSTDRHVDLISSCNAINPFMKDELQKVKEEINESEDINSNSNLIANGINQNVNYLTHSSIFCNQFQNNELPSENKSINIIKDEFDRKIFIQSDLCNQIQCPSPNSISNESTSNSIHEKGSNESTNDQSQCHLKTNINNDSNYTDKQMLDIKLNSLSEYEHETKQRLKFPNSIHNSKSTFINVTLMIICIMMLFDFNIHDSNQTVGSARKLYAVNDSKQQPQINQDLQSNYNYDYDQDKSNYENMFFEKIKDKVINSPNQDVDQDKTKNNETAQSNTQALINNNTDIYGDIIPYQYYQNKVKYQKTIDINFLQNLLMKRCTAKIKSMKDKRYAVLHSKQNQVNFNQQRSLSNPNSNSNSLNLCPQDMIKQDGEVEFQNLSSVMVHDGQFKLAPRVQRLIKSKHAQQGNTDITTQSGFNKEDLGTLYNDALKNQYFQMGYVMKDNAILEILGQIVDVNVYLDNDDI